MASAKVQGKVKVSRVNQLCKAMQQTAYSTEFAAWYENNREIVSYISEFRRDECEDVHKFINNY